MPKVRVSPTQLAMMDWMTGRGRAGEGVAWRPDRYRDQQVCNALLRRALAEWVPVEDITFIRLTPLGRAVIAHWQGLRDAAGQLGYDGDYFPPHPVTIEVP